MSLLRRLLIRWFNRHDPAIYSTGIRRVYSGYDEAKAMQASRDAKLRSETGRLFTVPCDPPAGGRLPASGLSPTVPIRTEVADERAVPPTLSVVAIRRKERA
jgi:uncharacterized protein (DUF2126 family)